MNRCSDQSCYRPVAYASPILQSRFRDHNWKNSFQLLETDLNVKVLFKWYISFRISSRGVSFFFLNHIVACLSFTLQNADFGHVLDTYLRGFHRCRRCESHLSHKQQQRSRRNSSNSIFALDRDKDQKMPTSSTCCLTFEPPSFFFTHRELSVLYNTLISTVECVIW